MIKNKFLIILTLFLISSFISINDNLSVDAISEDPQYSFPSEGLEREENRDELASDILDSMDLSNSLEDVWTRSNLSSSGSIVENLYHYNLTEDDKLIMSYSGGHFHYMEIVSKWGVNSDPLENMKALAGMIGISDIENMTVESDSIPYFNPKGEVRGYYNRSSIRDTEGFLNTNQIDFREVPKGEFFISQIRITAWFSGDQSFDIAIDDIIDDLEDELIEKEPILSDRYLIGGDISNYENKTIMDTYKLVPYITVSMYFTHPDPDDLYQVYSTVNAYDLTVMDYHVGVVANSSSYWPDDHQVKPRNGPDRIGIDDIIPFAILILAIPGIILILVFLSFGIMVRKRSRDIMDTIMRRRIFEAISEEPGIHFRKIMRQLNIKQGVLGFHLNILEKEDFIRSIQKGQYRCFYAQDAKSELRMKLNEAQQRILHEIEFNPGISLRDISRNLSRTSTLVHYHINILSEAGLVLKKKDGNNTSYFITSIGKDHINSM